MQLRETRQADVAQLVEHRTRNAGVKSSSLFVGTTKRQGQLLPAAGLLSLCHFLLERLNVFTWIIGNALVHMPEFDGAAIGYQAVLLHVLA